MIGSFIADPLSTLDKGRAWLKSNTRPHVLIGKTPKGYLLIDPRNKGGHYCQIVAKLYRKRAKD